MCWSSLHGLQVPVFAGQCSKVRGQSDVTTLLLTKVTGGSLQGQRGGQGALLVGAGASLTQTAPLAGIHGSTAKKISPSSGETGTEGALVPSQPLTSSLYCAAVT